MISWLRNKQVLRNKEKKGDSAMIRKIVQIEEDRCTGCGLCAHACHESAIAMVDGKAKLIRDDYCDGTSGRQKRRPDRRIPEQEKQVKTAGRLTVQMRRKILQQFRPGSASGRCRSSLCRSGLRCLQEQTFSLRQIVQRMLMETSTRISFEIMSFS